MRSNGEPEEGAGGVPPPGRFDTLGTWFQYVRSEGFSVPVQAPHAIARVMKAFDLDHQQAFDWLVERRLLMVRRGMVIINMRATQVDLSTVPEDGLDLPE